MSSNGSGPREIAVPVSVFDSLRSGLEGTAGTLQTVHALHDAGYKAGRDAVGTLHREAGGDSMSLGNAAFWDHLSDFLSKRGWGSLRHQAIHSAVGMLTSGDWAEAEGGEVSDDASCSFSSGYLSGLLSELAGGPIAVLEVSCRGRGDGACDFAFGSETAIHHLYGRLLDGEGLDTALAELG